MLLFLTLPLKLENSFFSIPSLHILFQSLNCNPLVRISASWPREGTYGVQIQPQSSIMYSDKHNNWATWKVIIIKCSISSNLIKIHLVSPYLYNYHFDISNIDITRQEKVLSKIDMIIC